jgi:hypothetical protein
MIKTINKKIGGKTKKRKNTKRIKKTKKRRFK